MENFTAKRIENWRGSDPWKILQQKGLKIGDQTRKDKNDKHAGYWLEATRLFNCDCIS